MRIQQSIASILSVAVAAALCFPPATWAQNTSPSPAPANPAPLAPVVPSSSQDQQQATAQKSQANGSTANPQAPPQPVTTYPDAAGNSRQPDATAQAQSTRAGQSQAQAPQTEPQGAATAEKVPAAGGAAAKPAGAAIAPAKQRQARSLLLKLGAVAAGAVAAGTIYGLSRGTPSTPPGANSPGATQKRSR